MTSISKKILTIFLAVTAAICLAFGVFLTVPKTASAEDIEISETYMNIENGVFRGFNDNVSEILSGGVSYKLTLPDEVTEIAEGKDTESILGSNILGLTELTIPASVKKIGANAFIGCSSLNVINYYATDALNGSENSPFRGVGGATVNIGGAYQPAVTQIPSYLFRSTNISSVVFTNINLATAEKFGQNAFENCVNLKTVSFSGTCSVKAIGKEAFSGCTALTHMDLEGTVTNLTDIGSGAFKGCSALKWVRLPDSVTQVNDAFVSCENLLEVRKPAGLDLTDKLPDSVLNVYDSKSDIGGSHCFHDDSGEYEFIYYRESEGSGYKALLIGYDGASTQLTLPEEVTIPANSVHAGYTIYKNAFSGNQSITSVTFPADKTYGVWEVQAGAFKDCPSLTEVDMQNTYCSYISESMFENCGALNTITISPLIDTIGAHAFENCAELSSVNILTGEDNYSSLKLISSSAFKGCINLLEISIPTCTKTVTPTTIADSAFAGCIYLEKVYLPQSATFSTRSFDDRAVDSPDLLLIAPDKESYGKYEDLDTKPSVGIFTYEVEVNLYSIPAEGSEAEKIEIDDEYFFGIAPDYMPIQPGYSVSVWYDGSNGTNKVDTASFGGKLAQAGVESITLYAYELVKPENVTINLNYSIDYNSNGQSISPDWFNGWSAEYNSKYTFVISRYVNWSHNTVEVKDKDILRDAGTYTLSLVIKDEAKYGQWAEGMDDFTVKVIPREIDANDLTPFTWGVVNGDEIVPFAPADGKVVKYDDDNPVLIPAEPIDNGNGIYSAYKSTLDYKNSEFTVKLLGGSEYIKDVSYISNVQGDRGMWISSAIVVLDNNYRLPTSLTSGTVTGAFDFGRENISISYNDANNTYIVSKTWFIIVSGGNKLKKGNADYSIAGWSYSKDGGPEIPAPELLYGNNEADDLLSYRLIMSDIGGLNVLETFNNFSHKDFRKYVNGSMPAGEYILEVSIKKYGEYEGTGGKPIAIKFTVEKGSITNLLNGNTGNLGRPLALTALYTGEKTFGDYERAFPVLSLSEKEIHPMTLLNSINGNVWLQYYKYYAPFDITFRVNNDSNYFLFDDHTGAPRAAGSYTIYYNIFSYSYEDRYNTSSNACSYTLTVQDMVTIGNVDVVYDGESWKDRIVAFINNPAFTVRYLDSIASVEEYGNIVNEAHLNLKDFPTTVDTYINTGVHWVVLVNSGRVNWSDEVTPVPGTNLALFSFRIAKATNYTTQNVSVSGWEWQNYEKGKNIISWSTRFVGDGITYDYVLVSQADGSKYYYNPVGDQKGFNEADAGTYWLKPIAWGNDNVFDFNTAVDGDKTYESEWGTVLILPATVTWKIAPRIESWKYGDDVANVINGNISPVITGELNSKFKDIRPTIYYCRLEDYGTPGAMTYPTLKDYIDSIGETYVPAGNYVYVYALSAGKNVNQWSYPVYFTVLKAQNYWDDAPVINGWNYGDANALSLTYKPHFGNVNNVQIDYWYVDENGTETERYNVNFATLAAGKYKYKVTLSGSSNYEALIFPETYFEVHRTQNRWEDVPVIAGWNQGRYNAELNAPTAKAVCGENVYFTIKDLEGNVVKGLEELTTNQLNSQKLNSLGVGTYILCAKVYGTADYSDLYTEIRFSVMEDSIGMSGLITATMVFAVIAVGLAVAGVILLIRRNKKIEEEFRKMIKTELRRK